MPVHDWGRVSAGTFHDFHSAWITHLKEAFNEGALPDGYYAMSEQQARVGVADVLTLQAPNRGPGASSSNGGHQPGVALADAPPRTSRKLVASAEAVYRDRRRTLVVRHVSGHRVVALLEILSPGDKDRASSVEDFSKKVVSALQSGIHVLLVDLFPPGRHDPEGVHGAIWANYGAEPYLVPADRPLTLASYWAGTAVEAYVEHTRFGEPLPDMPLFLEVTGYVNVPLEETYQAAYRGMPGFWREVLEQGPETTSPAPR